MDNDLTQALNVLRIGRVKLIDSYKDKNAERYRYSFKYESSPKILDIAYALLAHQWIDEQVKFSLELLHQNELSSKASDLIFAKIQRFSLFSNNQQLHIQGYTELLRTKMESFAIMLKTSDNLEKGKSRLEFDYYRDKALFEREMKKYLKEMEFE